MLNRTKASSKTNTDRALTWHELVQAGPKGDPKGDPKKAAKRAEAKRTGEASTHPEHQPKPSPGRSFSAGMTVLHRSRLRPLPTGHPARNTPRPDVMRRQLIRRLRSQGVTVIDEAKQVAA